MVKELRAEHHSAWLEALALSGARHYGRPRGARRTGLALLRLTDPLGIALARAICRRAQPPFGGQLPGLPRRHAAAGGRRPAFRADGVTSPNGRQSRGRVLPELPHTHHGRAAGRGSHRSAWRRPVARTRRPAGGRRAIPDGRVEASAAANRLAARASWTPPPSPRAAWSTCCGMRSRGGELPVVCDTSPCSGQLRLRARHLTGADRERWSKLHVLDFPTFMAREVLPTRVDVAEARRHVVLHPTCTLVKIGAIGRPAEAGVRHSPKRSSCR